MVRLKTRWLLVRLDVAATLSIQQRKEKKKNHPGNISIAEDAMTNLFPPRKELATAIRQNIAAHLGIAGEGAALSTQVRLWDPTTQLLLLRVPRDDCGRIRASLTVWTHLEHSPPTETTITGSTRKRFRIVASVLSVNGSARTAKRSALLHVRKWHRGRFLSQEETATSFSSKDQTPLTQRKTFDKDCRKLQDLISIIQAID